MSIGRHINMTVASWRPAKLQPIK